MRDDSLGENHGGVITGTVDRAAAKVEELPAAGVRRHKESRLGLSVFAPVLFELPRSGAAAIQVAPARHQTACAA